MWKEDGQGPKRAKTAVYSWRQAAAAAADEEEEEEGEDAFAFREAPPKRPLPTPAAPPRGPSPAKPVGKGRGQMAAGSAAAAPVRRPWAAVKDAHQIHDHGQVAEHKGWPSKASALSSWMECAGPEAWYEG